MKQRGVELLTDAARSLRKGSLVQGYQANIIEGLLITLNENRAINLSPMGVRFSNDGKMVLLRPFKTSRSFKNLARNGEAVFHVTDDASLIAHAALGDVKSLPALTPIGNKGLSYLTDACRWYYLRHESKDDTGIRASFDMRVSDRGFIREFMGFNRANFAIVEAAILATRVGILPSEKIVDHMETLEPSVDKTGGVREIEAFSYLKTRIMKHIASQENGSKDCVSTATGCCEKSPGEHL